MAWNIQEGTPVLSQQKISIPTGMAHICTLVPHHSEVTLEWVNSTYGPIIFLPRQDFAKSHRVSRGIMNLDTHRNVLVKAALEDKSVTHIFFLDTDCIAENPADPNESIRMLLSCNVPIVSGLYRAKKAKGLFPYAMWAKNPSGGVGYVDISSWTGNYLSVGAIGFGCVLIKREVFEKVSYPWFEWHEPPNPSEDFFACEKFAKFGYEVKVFTDVRFSHGMQGKVLCSDGKVTVLDV